MKQKLVKRISSFIPGLGGYNATSSVHPAAPTEKRTKSFNKDKDGGLLDINASKKMRRASMGDRRSLKAFVKDGKITSSSDETNSSIKPLDLSHLDNSDSDVEGELQPVPSLSVNFSEKKESDQKPITRTDSSFRRRAKSTRTKLWNDLNVEILKESATSALVILNMPTPMEDQEDSRYMGYLEALTDGLNRVVFCHGTGREIITVD